MNGLRDRTNADKERVRAWRNLPEIAQHMYTDHTISAEEHERWFRAIAGDKTRRYWIITCDGEDVGLVNLYNIDEANRRCYWAFYVAGENVRGKGVGSFVEYSVLQHVFEERGFHRLCCEVLARNEKVIEMHKNFGFLQEGCLRQHVVKGGVPLDVVSLAILKEDWDRNKQELGQRLKAKGIL